MRGLLLWHPPATTSGEVASAARKGLPPPREAMNPATPLFPAAGVRSAIGLTTADAERSSGQRVGLHRIGEGSRLRPKRLSATAARTAASPRNPTPAAGYPSIYGPRSTETTGPRPSRTSSCSACPVAGRLMRRVLAVDVHRSSRTLFVRIGDLIEAAGGGAGPI
jgi:hypothetical protein